MKQSLNDKTIDYFYNALCNNDRYLRFVMEKQDAIELAAAGLKVAHYAASRHKSIYKVSQKQPSNDGDIWPVDIVTDDEHKEDIETGKDIAIEMWGVPQNGIRLMNIKEFRERGGDVLENRVKRMAVLSREPVERHEFNQKLYNVKCSY